MFLTVGVTPEFIESIALIYTNFYNHYCEAHHLVPLSLNGGQEAENVIILCANHHRMFHYANNYIKWENVSESERLIKIDEKEYRVKYVKTKDLKL